MLKTVLAAMMAASALVPAAALAQDGHWHGRGGGDAQQGGGGQARPGGGGGNGGGWHGGGGGWNGGGRSFQPQAQQPQPQVQQPQADNRPQFRGGGGRPDGGWQGRGFNGGQRDSQAFGDRGRFDGADRGRFDGNRDAGFRGAQPRPFQQGNPQFRDDGNRRFDGDHRFDGDRGFDRGRSGFDGNRGYAGRPGGGYDRGFRNGWNDRGAWSRDWRHDGRYDYGGYRASNRYAFHLPRYYAPGGWGYGYRRFGIGFTLSSILFAEDYWIDDPFDYRLPPAYGPYRWVRYYDDALLVDVRTGQVVDAVYGIFW